MVLCLQIELKLFSILWGEISDHWMDCNCIFLKSKQKKKNVWLKHLRPRKLMLLQATALKGLKRKTLNSNVYSLIYV